MYIGIDLGTSSVKLLLSTKDGKVLRTISKEYPLYLKDSWSEQNPLDWYEKTIEGLKEVIESYEDQIQGIGFSGQMHGLVLLDKDDVVLRNAILWNDQRTESEVKYLNEEIGIEKLLEYTGNIALTGLTAPKVLWVKNNEPEIFSQINKIMLPKDYLIYRLTGKFVTDVSDVSGTLYYDVNNKEYSQEMLGILGIKEKMLPQVFESSYVIGDLLRKVKKELNITSTVGVVPGGGDQAVSAVGVGVVNDNQVSISLGTSGVIFVSSDSFKVDTKSYCQSYRHVNGKFHIMAVMLSAAGSLKWWYEEILKENDYVKLEKELSQSTLQDKLLFLPYLTGERAPINDSNARGVMFGLHRNHKPIDMTRSVIEGVTFALRDSIELIKKLGIDVTRVRVTGGGAKSNFWCQTIANVMNVEVSTLASEEGPALGAAILAMVGNKEYCNVQIACDKIVKTNNIYIPFPPIREEYQQKYEKFSKLYPTLKHLY